MSTVVLRISIPPRLSRPNFSVRLVLELLNQGWTCVCDLWSGSGYETFGSFVDACNTYPRAWRDGFRAMLAFGDEQNNSHLRADSGLHRYFTRRVFGFRQRYVVESDIDGDLSRQRKSVYCRVQSTEH